MSRVLLAFIGGTDGFVFLLVAFIVFTGVRQLRVL